MADDGLVRPAERVPPHNVEAEQSLLGSMFLSVDAVENAISIASCDPRKNRAGE